MVVMVSVRVSDGCEVEFYLGIVQDGVEGLERGVVRDGFAGEGVAIVEGDECVQEGEGDGAVVERGEVEQDFFGRGRRRARRCHPWS